MVISNSYFNTVFNLSWVLSQEMPAKFDVAFFYFLYNQTYLKYFKYKRRNKLSGKGRQLNVLVG